MPLGLPALPRVGHSIDGAIYRMICFEEFVEFRAIQNYFWIFFLISCFQAYILGKYRSFLQKRTVYLKDHVKSVLHIRFVQAYIPMVGTRLECH